MNACLVGDPSKTAETLAPVQQQLQDLERTLAEQQRQVYAVTANILRNEATIKQMLDMHAQSSK